MTFAKSVYRALLYCYPAAFRSEYGDQMQLLFGEQLGEARRNGVLRTGALWLDAARDAVTVAPKEHFHVIHQDLRYAFRTMAAAAGGKKRARDSSRADILMCWASARGSGGCSRRLMSMPRRHTWS